MYYLAKFRGLHNHPLELNLLDTDHFGNCSKVDPARLTREGKIYGPPAKRFVSEKAVVSEFLSTAQKDVIFGQMSLAQEGNEAVPHIAEIKNETCSMHSLGGY